MSISAEIQELMIGLKNMTGKFQVKLFQKIDDYLTPVGSGTLLTYRGKCFLLTCAHCVKYLNTDNYNELIVPIGPSKEGSYSPRLLSFEREQEWDLAVFEVSCNSLSCSNGRKEFIQQDLIDDIVSTPLSETDFIILHATPWGNLETTFSNDEIVVELVTQPYFTVFEDYYREHIRLSIDERGLGEDGKIHIIKTIAGMSGSPAFRYDEETKGVKFFGILSNGDVHSQNLYVIPINIIKTFLDSLF